MTTSTDTPARPKNYAQVVELICPIIATVFECPVGKVTETALFASLSWPFDSHYAKANTNECARQAEVLICKWPETEDFGFTAVQMEAFQTVGDLLSAVCEALKVNPINLPVPGERVAPLTVIRHGRMGLGSWRNTP